MLDLVTGFSEDAQMEIPQSTDFSRPVRADAGTWTFRFWPLRDRSGNVKIVDFVAYHFVGVPGAKGKTRWIRCRRDKRLDALADLREKNGDEDAWKIRHRMKAFALVRLFSSPQPGKHPVDVILELNRPDVVKIQGKLETARSLGVKSLLDTTAQAPPFVLTVTGAAKGRKSQVEMADDPVAMEGGPEVVLPQHAKTIEDLFLAPEQMLLERDWSAISRHYGIAPKD